MKQSTTQHLLLLITMCFLLVFISQKTQGQTRSCTLSDNPSSCQGVSDVAFWMATVPGYTGNQNVSNGLNLSLSGGSITENYTNGTATMAGTLTQGDLSYSISINLSGRTTSGSPGHSSGCSGYQVGSTSDWYYYTSSSGSLTCTSGNASDVSLTQKGGAFEVGTGANLWDSGAYGGAGWFYLNGTSQSDFGPVFDCPPPVSPCNGSVAASNTGSYCGTPIEIQLNSSITGTEGTVTYSWTGPLGFTSDLPNPTTVNGVGTYRVTISYTNADDIACTATAATTVIINTKPATPVAPDVTRCGIGTLTLKATGCSPVSSTDWYTSTGTTPILMLTTDRSTYTTPSLSTTTTYRVKCRGVATCLGNFVSIKAIIETAAPIITVDAKTICEGESATLTTSNCVGGIVSWNTGVNGISLTVTPVATTEYTATCTTGCGKTTAKGTVTVQPKPTAPAAVVSQATCNAAGTIANDDATIIISGIANGNTYAINGGGSSTLIGGIIALNALPNPTSAKTYTIQVFNTTGNTTNCFTEITAILQPKTCSPTCTTPTGVVVDVAQATCTGATANIDGKIIISGALAGYTYDYIMGSTYAGTATFATATTIPVGGIIVNNLPNPVATDQAYTVRIFSGDNCYVDKVITLLKKDCNCLPVCLPLKSRKI